MDWDDILDDDRYDDERSNLNDDFVNHQLLENVSRLQPEAKSFTEKTRILMEQLELEQPIISKKSHFNAYLLKENLLTLKNTMINLNGFLLIEMFNKDYEKVAQKARDSIAMKQRY